MENNLNLVPAIKAIENEIKKLDAEHNKKIKPYIDSLIQLREINTACEFCCGKGKILRKRSCAEDDRPDPEDPRDYVICPSCGGSGLLLRDRREN